jgi:hypothetical protein
LWRVSIRLRGVVVVVAGSLGRNDISREEGRTMEMEVSREAISYMFLVDGYISMKEP